MSHIEQLVARQLEYCELRKRREEEYEAGQHHTGPPKPGPTILISRERGSGGGRVAQMIGERLGWHVFDREIVEEIAKRTHIREQLVASVDEHVRSRWGIHRRKSEAGTEIEWQEYLHQLRQVILALGYHGHAILVGRGAQWILPREGSLRIRIIAPLEVRLHRLAELEKCTVEAAHQAIEEADRQRSAFLRKAFGHDATEAHDYDLVVNTGDLSLSAAANIILSAAKEHLAVQPEPVPCSR